MAFMIPLFPNLYGLMIMIMVLEQLIRRRFSSVRMLRSKLSWRNPAIWLLLFYLMHFVSFIYSENMSFAWMDVGMKASFIVFPVIFFFFQPRINWKVTIALFLLGVFTSISINLILSFNKYLETDVHHYLFGERLSHFMHRGYWSIFLTIAYVLIFEQILRNPLRRFYNYFGLLVVLIVVFMSASKISILLLLLVSVYYLFFVFKRMNHKGFMAVILVTLIGSIFLVVKFTPQLSSRIYRATESVFVPVEEMDKVNIESTTARIFMWDTAIDLIRDNFWLGVGSGDVKDELQALNYQKGYIGVAEKNLNSHNQFLNTHVAIGFFGVVFLFLSYFFAFSFSKRPNRSIQNWIVFILFMAALPEAFLETQAGIVPCAFILVLFGYKNKLADLQLLNSSNMK